MSWAGLTFVIVFLASRGGGSRSQGGCMLSCRRESPLQYVQVKGKELDVNREATSAGSEGSRKLNSFRGINPSIHIAAIGFILSQPGL